MKQHHILIPALLATALAAPAAFAQGLGVNVGGQAGVGVQTGPVSTHLGAQGRIEAQSRTDALRQSAQTAREVGGQVGTTARDTARMGAQAGERASATAMDAVSGNATAAANAAVLTGAEVDAGDTAEPEEMEQPTDQPAPEVDNRAPAPEAGAKPDKRKRGERPL